jgi:hypothetical protein
LIRHILETENDYGAVKKYLKKSTLIAPRYITLGGSTKGQGSIITRTREGTDKIVELSDKSGDYLVQTNIDRDRLNDPSAENII